MGWWPFGKQQEKNKDLQNTTNNSNTHSENQKHLNDLVSFEEQPKTTNKSTIQKPYDDNKGGIEIDNPAGSNMQNVLTSVKLNDFQFGNLVKIPCFRDSGLIGLSTMFVLTSVIFLSHKSISKAFNWGYLGGMLGSLVGWEQCRSQRKKSFENVEMAKATIKAKPHPMMHNKKLNSDEKES